MRHQGHVQSERMIVDEVPNEENKKFVQCNKCDRYQFERDMSKSGGKCVYCDELLSEQESKNEGVKDLVEREVVEEKKDEMVVVPINDDIDDGMKKCVNCGEMMSKDYKFCDKCGAKAVVEEEDKNKCVNCNESIGMKCKFCPNCGTMQ